MIEVACERAQLALIEGAPDTAVRAHVAGCGECGFFEQLSRELGSVTHGASAAAPLGAGFAAVLEAAVTRGEPLLGRYQLRAPLGQGGEGIVYRATDRETGEEVALKLARLRGEHAEEVANARRVRHENVCRVYHTERHGDLRLLVMELIEGPSLEEALPAMDRRARRRAFREVCAGAAAAHRAGVLHLDLKPRNVLLRDGITAVLTDFGLSARAGDAGVKARGGTPAFMAPEQRGGGAVDVRTDVHGLGKLAALLLGEGRISRRACQADPAARYPDVAALLRDLGRPRRRTIATGAVAAVALAITGVVMVATRTEAGSGDPPAGRAGWRSDLWSTDTVPPRARNVALNIDGAALPRVTASDPPFACARSLADLQDGVTQYAQWEHGYAFPPPPDGVPGTCVSLGVLGHPGQCGELRPEAPLCEQRAGGHVVLDARVADAARIDPARRRKLGQLEPGELPCGERSITVELDGEHDVVAVRTWHHDHSEAPARLAVEIPDGAGGWRRVFATAENRQALAKAHYTDETVGSSAPLTADFAPVTTAAVRFVMDTCTTIGAICADQGRTIEDVEQDRTGCTPGHGWLYEVEVFALP